MSILVSYVSPCGRHILFFPPSVYVSPSVCYATLVRAISPRTFRAKNWQKKNPKLTYILKLCNEKSKFNFAKNVGSFGQKKTLFEFVLCPGQISVTIKDRDTGFSVVLAKKIPLCNVRVKYAKCQILVDFEQFLQF